MNFGVGARKWVVFAGRFGLCRFCLRSLICSVSFFSEGFLQFFTKMTHPFLSNECSFFFPCCLDSDWGHVSS